MFLKTPKNIEIQKFDPKKMDRAYVCMKISEYPPPPGLSAQIKLFLLLDQIIAKSQISMKTQRGNTSKVSL